MTLEQEKDDLKAKLINLGYFKTPDNRQLYELTYRELENIYNQLKGANHSCN
ncbi:Fur-regulated basic protein FbpA [Cytobacillus oceanisediminis]|uniref:Fur-regulated basic protein FbpA n=1 Tax=Cytobacillus oceanisediminis TaxID=665099 RepID=UPI001CCE5A0F|nr:Fur-regulated basic protein FbpA [Cytobacillus oceanisediminis]MBZ9537060.1 Fur-regulated basic protein FbpA [Cytobacillus oceanisediminis]